MEIGNDKVKIIRFTTFDSYVESKTFEIDDLVTFNVLWEIPSGIQFKGKVLLKIKGKYDSGGKWVIIQRKDIENSSAYYGECRFYEKIHKLWKSGSNVTATVTVKVDGYKTARKTSTFKIKNKN